MEKRRRRIPRYQREADEAIRTHGRRDPEHSGRPKDVPSEQEINVFDSLDEKSAAEHFLGKTLSEAEALFRKNDLYYLGDLMWMGPKAFGYYVVAAINYIQGGSGGLGALSQFAGILRFRLEQPEAILPILPVLRDATQFILDHWEKYDVGPHPFGDVRGEYAALLGELTELSSGTR